MHRVLVAGGAGYVGVKLVERLQIEGCIVTVVDDCWFGNHLPPATLLEQRDLWTLDADYFRNSKIDTLIFLAGVSNDPMADFSPSENFRGNAALPAYLTYCARRGGCRRAIVASSCSVYGSMQGELVDEFTPVTCTYPYGISKLQAEAGCLAQVGDGFSVICLRKGTVGGYSPRMRLDLVVNAMTRDALRGRPVRATFGQTWRSVLNIEDAVEAYWLATTSGDSISGTFNIVGETHQVEDIGRYVQAAMGVLTGQSPELVIEDGVDIRNYRARGDRAREVLGFVPRHTIADSVASIVRARDTFADWDAERYYNVATFRRRFES